MARTSSRNWLEIAEYLSLLVSAIGFIMGVVLHQTLYALAPILLALLLNFLNRQRLAQQMRSTDASTLYQLNQHKAAVDGLIEQLKTAIVSLAAATPQLDSQTPNSDQPTNLKPIVSAIKNIKQRQKVLEETIKLLQTELDMTSKQFKHRPELEQIESLTRVILDLQAFINQLPQWGTLQQRQLIDLQQKVEDSLAKMSEELAKIPLTIEETVRRHRQEMMSQSSANSQNGTLNLLNPQLQLHETNFAPGQEIVLSFAASPTYADDAWIGIIPSEIDHGSSELNDKYALSYQYLTGRTSGILVFRAPAEEGIYDFRMHDTDNKGKEVCFVSFKVGKQQVA